MGSLIDVARGVMDADLLVKNANVYNPFVREWEKTDFAIYDGRIAGIGSYHAVNELDLRGLSVAPGFIDAHVHIESSLLVPSEYGRLVLSHGTTTVIADPHEIANVCGIAGIEYMLAGRGDDVLDILYTLPSCVPATPLDESVEILDASILSQFIGREGIVGLAEMMNVPGVLNQNPDVMKKLTLSPIRDGHAPYLTGPDLQAYIAAGVQSDHETLTDVEGREKIRSGMFLFLREGSTEHNLKDLLSLVTPATAGRCSYCTDDRHVDLLVESGHMDDCIRKAIETGLEPELAYLLATLSPADRFGLSDRGALTPGRLADFCVIDDIHACNVIRTFRKGVEVRDHGYMTPAPCQYTFRTRVPDPGEIKITGEGEARVIGLIPGQIATESLTCQISDDDIPDIGRDILKVVVASRYDNTRVAVGLVHGLQIKEGAIASSVAHDGHHLIAAGSSDDEILKVCAEVIRYRGGMACIHDNESMVLPLSSAGLMAEAPYEEVYTWLRHLTHLVRQTGSIENPFMYLSFLSLTVIPALRITPMGVFDGHSFAQVPLFVSNDT